MWRKSRGIGRMVLLGHSFGGYFSACYAMRYPEHVEKLILASPVGMGEKTCNSPATNMALRAELPLKQRLLYGFAEWAWGAYWTPQALIRLLGPFGWRLPDMYVTRRFQHAREAGTKGNTTDADFKEYMHQLSAQRACGEYCLGELLEFGVWAKKPVGSRFVERWKQLGNGAPPVTFLYGEHDWMDKEAGLSVAGQCPGTAEVFLVERAGHQLFVEHPRAFNAVAQRVLSGKGADTSPGLYRRLWPSVSSA
jgi:cardiolipin-specific phospholipase